MCLAIIQRPSDAKSHWAEMVAKAIYASYVAMETPCACGIMSRLVNWPTEGNTRRYATHTTIWQHVLYALTTNVPLGNNCQQLQQTVHWVWMLWEGTGNKTQTHRGRNRWTLRSNGLLLVQTKCFLPSQLWCKFLAQMESPARRQRKPLLVYNDTIQKYMLNI